MRVFRGKRSKVYCIFNIGIKVERWDSKAINRIKNESKWLRILNKYGIGPKIYFSFDNFMVFRFIKGERILDYFRDASKEDKIRVVKEVLRQCRILDKLKVDKLEMHHPVKHIIIGRKIVMIDFERCRNSLKPKNVTQFAQFLDRLGFKIDKKILKEYKRDYNDKSFEKILSLI